MTTIYLTRHGQTEWNVEGRMQGRMDSNLTLVGKEQAVWLGEHLKDTDFSAIITSSSGRAKQTAELIGGDRHIPIIENHLLKEIDLADWEGKRKQELNSQAEFKNFWELPHTYQPNQGESFDAVMKRAGGEVEKIAESYKGEQVLVVTHAVVLKGLLAYFHGKKVEDFWTGAFMHPTSLTIAEKVAEGWRVLLEGDISHHPSSAQTIKE